MSKSSTRTLDRCTIMLDNYVVIKFKRAFSPQSVAMWVLDQARNNQELPKNSLKFVDVYLDGLGFDEATLLDLDANRWTFYVKEGIQAARITFTSGSWFSSFMDNLGYAIPDWWFFIEQIVWFLSWHCNYTDDGTSLEVKHVQ